MEEEQWWTVVRAGKRWGVCAPGETEITFRDLSEQVASFMVNTANSAIQYRKDSGRDDINLLLRERARLQRELESAAYTCNLVIDERKQLEAQIEAEREAFYQSALERVAKQQAAEASAAYWKGELEKRLQKGITASECEWQIVPSFGIKSDSSIYENAEGGHMSYSGMAAQLAIDKRDFTARIDAILARGNYGRADYNCDRCGGVHAVDTVIPSPVWNQITAGHDEWSMLCTRCIDELCQEAGLTVFAHLYYAGSKIVGPGLFGALYGDDHETPEPKL